MKSLRIFLCLLAVGALMTACQKDNAEETVLDTNDVFSKESIAADFAEYQAQHKELKIEYTTLEELNQIFLENGQPTVTLEELGVTEEEYQLAQERIHNPAIAKDRCAGALAVYYGDMSGNQVLSGFDISQAQSWIYIYGDNNSVVTPAGSGYRRFGLFSSETGIWPGTVWDPSGENLYLNSIDKTIATRIVLGLYTCI